MNDSFEERGKLFLHLFGGLIFIVIVVALPFRIGILVFVFSVKINSKHFRGLEDLNEGLATVIVIQCFNFPTRVGILLWISIVAVFPRVGSDVNLGDEQRQPVVFQNRQCFLGASGSRKQLYVAEELRCEQKRKMLACQAQRFDVCRRAALTQKLFG